MTQLYGVSYGNGNDGVSHMFADFYVRTDDPWTLARAATIDAMKAEFQAQATEAMEVDGEAEYTITAMILEPLGKDVEEDEDGEPILWSEGNGAWFLCEVFPVDDDEDTRNQPVFDSLEDALTAEALTLARKD